MKSNDRREMERERDEALRDVKQLHDAAVETEDKIDALKDRVKVLEDAIRKYREYRRSMQAGYDTGEQDEILYAVLAREKEKETRT